MKNATKNANGKGEEEHFKRENKAAWGWEKSKGIRRDIRKRRE